MADYEATEYGLCPSWALSLGYMGVAAGACLSNWGSAVSSVLFDVRGSSSCNEINALSSVGASWILRPCLLHMSMDVLAEHVLDYDCVAYIFNPIFLALCFIALSPTHIPIPNSFFGPSIMQQKPKL